ncbi:bifunctional DNA-formamidopyrimidine glycosylase/DNA-(apurinic or apyrimidinic site) lyase [Arthrobacter sp. JZ12]|uniref:bifunctional DNA-formamidopyrimidine glycosylase/DNA-(apurinic or apyrimidinic site) lyase n=1 Tax=Arthrobacter sp. JZ12 TaxID=2654190 RepID=UPI002B48D674|nr:bifunctional DNA-formamidopyrimidine glycosylase/DNA-(apurinic or apyrimidinic site) lyase [Arthrobacter sp. JZ12]WRH25131.1 bifunctional DNA-formamidopyrimidine glycosylase/DNA-(apurinic or apyrimidinic site) lyase [Arthrobacter sp. JZ12]
MPELPEVEVVRRGLARWVRGRRIESVEVLDQRSIRRHALGVEDFRGNLVGARVADAVRRGKFLWLPLAVPDDDAAAAVGESPSLEPGAPPAREPVALMAHLGMSGQLLVEDAGQPDEKHLKVRLVLSSATDAAQRLPEELRFVDQRIFGGLFVTSMVPTADGRPGGLGENPEPVVPVEAAHIARDPLDPAFSFEEFYRRLRSRRTGIKRALLDQSLISGIGNIYADESLWAARLHYARPTETLRRPEATRLVDACRDVMVRALEAGGTSFDSLYVNVNGASGYFARSLNAYGRENQPCLRCAEDGRVSQIRRDTFMNRSSYTCPRCQPRPRNGRW